MHNKLYFLQQESAESLESSLNIIKKTEVSLLTHIFNFFIIGQSHYIYSEAIRFHELFSCLPIEDAICLKLSEKHFNHEFENITGDLSINTKIFSEDFENSFQNSSKNYQLSHTFEPAGFTGISFNDSEYKTVHTYPEWNKVVTTITSLNSDS